VEIPYSCLGFILTGLARIGISSTVIRSGDFETRLAGGFMLVSFIICECGRDCVSKSRLAAKRRDNPEGIGLGSGCGVMRSFV